MTDPGAPHVLKLGVTGHRDPDPLALPQLYAEVINAFAHLEKTVGLPIVVLSSLAEGADRLAAEIALQRGHRLVVPLPLAVEEYEKDFATEGSRVAFRDLLARAQRWFVVAPQPDEEAVAQQDRNAAYRRAGVLIARDCQWLLALWDGVDNGEPGGTSDIVNVQRSAGGLVVHIHTPRIGDEQPVAVVTRWPVLTPG